MITVHERALALLNDPGSPLPPSFGDAGAELAALIQDVGLLPRADMVAFEVRGSDAQEYLHRMLTQDLRSLDVHSVTRACFLSVKGRFLGDFLVWNRGHCFWLLGQRLGRETALPGLERFVIADDVVFEDVTDRFAVLALDGPRGPDALEHIGAEAPEPNCGVEAATRAGRLMTLSQPRRGTSRLLLITERTGAARLLESLFQWPGMTLAGQEAAEFVRVALADPRLGVELDQTVLFNEAGLEGAISYAKGCFPGQEPVVMARHRGHPPRHLLPFRLEGPTPSRGTSLLLDGAEVGSVVTVAGGPQLGQALALAFVRHAYREQEVFDLATGGRAVRRQPGVADLLAALPPDWPLPAAP